jgi:hypothetical protein
MKPYTYALLAAAAACGLAAAETAYTTPVGYETLSASAGFNYLGLRLHEPTVAAGTVDTINATTMTDAAVNFGTVLTGGAATTYIVEFKNNSGVIQEITGASASGNSITLVQNITASVSAGAEYRIRKAATLASVFGAANSVGLTPGFSGSSGADVVYIPDGAGGFGQYYYDEDNASWSDATNGLPVTAASVPIVYPDGIILFANASETITVTGEVKTFETLHAVLPNFNYLSSVYPAGATLASAFNGAIPSLNPGFSGSSGADVIYVPDGLGNFGQYYYDEDNASWSDANSGLPVTATSISLSSGIIFFNAGSAKNLLNQEPASYSTL